MLMFTCACPEKKRQAIVWRDICAVAGRDQSNCPDHVMLQYKESHLNLRTQALHM